MEGQIEDDPGPSTIQVSGCYKISKGSCPSPAILIEHCCLMIPENKWNIDVKCRSLSNSGAKPAQKKGGWRNVRDVYPDAKVEHKHNDIEVTFPRLKEDLEIAAFGKPGKDDQKRMQMMIFGKEPTQGKDWKIWVYLVDDTTTAYKQVCQRQEERGHRLLVPLAGMFVSNSKKDIRIKLRKLQPGWKIKGSEVKTIKSNAAWNSPENSTDFPCCHFQISHVERTNQAFFCVITASHEQDTAISEIVAYFKRKRGHEIIHPSKNLPKVDNFCQLYSSKDTTGWLPMLLAFFFPSLELQISGIKDSISKHRVPHYLTTKASTAEWLKKHICDVFQNQRVKEVNSQ